MRSVKDKVTSVVSLGKKSQPRIFVKKGDVEYVVPYWISNKGNLCWKIEETVYVKLRTGFTMMLENGEWVPADAKTKATVETSKELLDLQVKVQPFRGFFPED